jgi:hypothetical protein
MFAYRFTRDALVAFSIALGVVPFEALEADILICMRTRAEQIKRLDDNPEMIVKSQFPFNLLHFFTSSLLHFFTDLTSSSLSNKHKSNCHRLTRPKLLLSIFLRLHFRSIQANSAAFLPSLPSPLTTNRSMLPNCPPLFLPSLRNVILFHLTLRQTRTILLLVLSQMLRITRWLLRHLPRVARQYF